MGKKLYKVNFDNYGDDSLVVSADATTVNILRKFIDGLNEWEGMSDKDPLYIEELEPVLEL